MNTDHLQIGKIKINPFTMKQTLQKIGDLVEAGNGGIVFTPNVDHIVLSEENNRFMKAYQRADISIADGMPLVWASKLTKTKLPERVAGSSLLEPLLFLSSIRNYRVFFLGSSEKVLKKAIIKAKKLYPSIQIVGHSSPTVSSNVSLFEVEEAMKAASSTEPDIIVVALGAPKQEIFISQAKHYYHRGVFLGLGASLDFFAGDIKRAPKWMQSSGLEWAYRLAKEPKRLYKRYMRDLKFPLIVGKQVLNGRDETGRHTIPG